MSMQLAPAACNDSLSSPRSSTSSAGVSPTPPFTPTFEFGPSPAQIKMDSTGVDPLAKDSFAAPQKATPAQQQQQQEQQDQLQAQLAAFQLGEQGKAARTRITRRPLNLPEPPASLPQASEGPQAGFSFGTCPSKVLGTPRAELGPFEYPAPPTNHDGDTPVHSPPVSARSSFSSAHRATLPLGETHRRGSIISRPSDRVLDGNVNPLPVPEYRRSSTTGNIHTVPVAGRRPSILHSTTIPSATVPLAVAPAPVSPSAATPNVEFPQASSSTATPSGAVYSPLLASRRGSLMFQPKSIPAPIPPSLLARRSSIPASQLYAGLTIDQLPPPPDSLLRKRASVSSYIAPAGFATTSHALYQRRSSMMSDGAESSGTSTNTVVGDSRPFVDPARRASMRYGDDKGMAEGSEMARRRMSLPHTHAFGPLQPLHGGSPSGQASPRSRASPARDTPSSPNFGPRSGPDSPRSQAARFSLAERRTRNSIDRSRISFTSSLSSSEESAEEDAAQAQGSADEGTSEIESLPTPGSVTDVGGIPTLHGSSGDEAVGFSDPWAQAGAAEKHQGVASWAAATQLGDRRGSGGALTEWADAQRRSRVSARGRPSLETIPSDSTARGSDDA